MILGFKQKFKDGTPTYFKEKIMIGEKIHTLREDPHDRWHEGRMIEMATGVRTKNYEQFNKDRPAQCISVQKVSMYYFGEELRIKVDGKVLSKKEILHLMINDGLPIDQFIKWFFPKGCYWSGKIIHWTDFKY